MIVKLSSDAERDIAGGYEFYEGQSAGLGSYFRDCIVADIESLSFHGGIHQMSYGYHRMLAKRFPFAIYYKRDFEVNIYSSVPVILNVRRVKDPRFFISVLSAFISGSPVASDDLNR